MSHIFKSDQRGFVPLIVIFLLLIIAGATGVIIKTGVLVGPQPTPDKGFEGSVSAQIKPRATPNNNTFDRFSNNNRISPKSLTTPTPSPSPSPSITATNNTSSQSPTPVLSLTPTPTTTPSSSPPNPSPTPIPTPSWMSYFTVDTTNVEVTLRKSVPNYSIMGSSYIYGYSYGKALTIHNVKTKDYTMYNHNPKTYIHGIYEGSGNMELNQDYTLHVMALSTAATGTYTGTYSLNYRDESSQWVTGPTISYTIHLND